MPGRATAMEPVEPQSLKKLSFKSLKRALDLFSPNHGHYAPPDPESQRIRISCKVNAEYGVVKNLSSEQKQEQGSHAPGQGSQTSDSSALVLAGSQNSRDAQKDGGQNSVVLAPVQPKGMDANLPSRSVTGSVISVPGSAERGQIQFMTSQMCGMVHTFTAADIVRLGRQHGEAPLNGECVDLYMADERKLAFVADYFDDLCFIIEIDMWSKLTA